MYVPVIYFDDSLHSFNAISHVSFENTAGDLQPFFAYYKGPFDEI